MKQVEHPEKIGLALTEDEFWMIIQCTSEVYNEMEIRENSRDSTSTKKHLKKLESLSNELKEIYCEYWNKKPEAVEYKVLPEENCEAGVCD